MKRFDSHGNELPTGVFQRKDRYHVLLSIKGVYASHGSFETISEAKEKVKAVKIAAGIFEPVPEPEPPAVPTDQISLDQETKKCLLLLKIRNEIASKEAYVAIANMETKGVEWSHPWDVGWQNCGKNIKTLIAELEEMIGKEAQNGQS